MSSNVLGPETGLRSERPAVHPYVGLGIGIFAVSTAAILISFARQEHVPAVAIAALRLTIAALVLAPTAAIRSRGEWRQLSRGEIALALVSGILLAIHFAFWISSLDYTSVMSSVVLVSTNPLFVGVASALFLRETLKRWTVTGILVAAFGGAVIGLVDLGQGGVESLQGDALALAGAVAASGYLLIGRKLRQRISLLGYISLVYSTAAVALIFTAWLMGISLVGYSWSGYAFVLLLAAGPQLIGHSSYNWALRYLSATFVTVTLLAEPIGASLLAMPLLAQFPSAAKIAGGALILLGIYLAARGESEVTWAETTGSTAKV